MRFSASSVLAAFFALPASVRSFSSSDTLQDADVWQSGYVGPNHNINPSQLSTYKINWTATYNVGEAFYAKPLVWTAPGSSTESVILASNQNVIRVVNGLTGAVQSARTLWPPFDAGDSSCGDIPTTIGVTGTPIIDPATNIMYFYSKGYKNGKAGPQGGSPDGTLAGQYKLFALNLPSLTDAPGFPISIEGKNANNDRSRYIIGGTILQRTGLAMIGNTILAGFGGHCDNFNYTGYLISASKTPGVGITNIQTTMAAPGALPQSLDIMGQYAKAGIWMSGSGLAVDTQLNRVLFVTGNGKGPGQLQGVSGRATSGKTYLSTLEQTVAAFSVDGSSGALTQNDWYAPKDYDDLNGGDRDFGSGGVALLDPAVFSGGGVDRIAVAVGKIGRMYVMDLDNLGGYRTGAGADDGILQVEQLTGSFFNQIASYPAEGGYIYVAPTTGPLYAYKFGIVNGKPKFTLAGQTQATFAAKGSPTVTSFNGKAGTGVVWMADVNIGLVAYQAVPVNGVLQPLTLAANTGRLQKNQRAVFGNGRIYTSQTNKIIAVAPPGAQLPPPVVSSTSSSTTRTTTSTSSSSAAASSTTSSSTTRSTTTTSSSSAAASSSTTTSSSSAAASSTSSTSSSTSSITTTSSSTSSTITSSSTIRSSSTSSTSSTSTRSSLPPYTTPTPPNGKTITYNWNIGWVNAAPDGFSRPFIGINGQWPPPPIIVNYGEQVKINIVNQLGNESTAIHFHGLSQLNTTFEDGPAMVTQCPIPPGSSFVYQFRLLQIGTYWYHAHIGGQYIDGLRAPLIVKDPNPPFTGLLGKIDNDVTLTLTDVYHDEAPRLVHYFLSPQNTDETGGAEPVPNSALMNEAQNVKFTVTPGKTNMFRIINMGAIAGYYLQFDQHVMTIVEVDGIYVQPYDVTQLFVAVAQRYSVIIKSKANNAANYAIVATMMADMFGSSMTPPGMQPTVTGWLVYDAGKALPAPFTLQPQPFDDSRLEPIDRMPLLGPVGRTIYLTASIAPDAYGITRAYFNGRSYFHQKVPTLYTALTAPADVLNNPAIYGTGANAFVIPYGTVVEISINNHDGRAHPFHLHGHAFQVVTRAGGGDLWPGLDDPRDIPMRRDTVVVYAESGATLRFRADNPGIQLFHCHTEWHVESGLTVTFIEAPNELVASKPYIPASHREVCDSKGIPRKGNAGGNSKNWLDLSGAPDEPPMENWGALVNPPTS
jgi:iron transport multicopper oxidase